MSSLRETIHLLAGNGGAIKLESWLFKVERTPGTVPPYSPFFGMRGHVIDSDAIVIDEAKALPEPKEHEQN